MEKILKEILSEVKDIKSTLGEHTQILNQHSKTLGEHTQILNQHSKTLETHTQILNQHSITLETHTQILNQHSITLETHTQILGEHTQLLRALEHSAQVNKAEHDNMNLDIAEIKGEVKAMRRDLSAVEIITANNWSDIVKIKAVK